MYLNWMGKNRFFVEKMIQFANMYAAVYKKEELYGTEIPISFEQVQVLEYLLENERLNQNMAMIAQRLGITPSNFTRIVNKLVKKGLLEKYYMEGNRKNIIIRVTDSGRELYQTYSRYISENFFSGFFEASEEISEEVLHKIGEGMERSLRKQKAQEQKARLIPVEKEDEVK